MPRTFADDLADEWAANDEFQETVVFRAKLGGPPRTFQAIVQRFGELDPTAEALAQADVIVAAIAKHATRGLERVPRIGDTLEWQGQLYGFTGRIVSEDLSRRRLQFSRAPRVQTGANETATL